MAEDPSGSALPPPPDPPGPTRSVRNVEALTAALLIGCGLVAGLVCLVVVQIYAPRPGGGGMVLFSLVLLGGTCGLCLYAASRVLRNQR